jgi:Heavy-metal resistance
MSDMQPPPARRFNWLKIALVCSLALNLLIGAAIATRYVRGPAVERFPGGNVVQLVPRKFLSELSRERRRELVKVLSGYRKDIRVDREEARALAVKLADAIDAEPYSPDGARAAVTAFTAQGGKLVTRGGDATLEILGMLTPEERKQLAVAIRERATQRKR